MLNGQTINSVSAIDLLCRFLSLDANVREDLTSDSAGGGKCFFYYAVFWTSVHIKFIQN